MTFPSRRKYLARSVLPIVKKELSPKRMKAILMFWAVLLMCCFIVGTNTSTDFWLLFANAFSLQSSNNNDPVFSLLVTLEFSGEEFKKKFLKDIQPVAEHCKANEPGTLAYEVLLSDKDPLQVLVLERYQDKEVAYLQVHKSSTPFLEFRAKLQAMQEGGHVRISGHSYLDSMVGFGDRT